MTGGFEIRRLGAGDAALCRAMAAVFARAFGEEGDRPGARPSEPYLRERLRDAGVIALVAIAGGEVVGGLTAYVLRKVERERAEVYLYDLAVDEGHRRRGVATALIAALGREAAALGAGGLYVQADPDDAAAVALYERLGARQAVLHFDLPVPPAP